MHESTGSTPLGASNVTTVLRRYLSGRRGLMILALLLAGTGMYLGWGWLVAAGVAPVLLAIAPCAAMCALGLCMSKMGGNSCSTTSKPDSDRQ